MKRLLSFTFALALVYTAGYTQDTSSSNTVILMTDEAGDTTDEGMSDEDILGDIGDDTMREDEKTSAKTSTVFPVSGYVEVSSFFINDPQDPELWHWQNPNKLKLKFDKRGKGFRVLAEANLLFYTGYTTMNLIDYLPDSIRIPLESARSMFGYTLSNSIDVARAYVAFDAGPLTFTFGRQPLAIGSGYVWNPVDILTEKNVMDPTYELTGHDAIMISSALPLNGEVKLAVSVGDSITNVNGIFMAKIHAAFDWALSASTRAYNSLDYTTFTSKYYRDWNVGFYFSGQIWDIGMHGEVAYNITENPTNYFKWLIGVDYTFKFQNQMMLEFYRDDSGGDTKEEYGQAGWLAYMTGKRQGLGRSYMFFSSVQTITDTLKLSAGLLMNLNDISATIFPEVLWKISDDIEARFMVYIPVGETNTEYGTFTPNIVARVTGHF